MDTTDDEAYEYFKKQKEWLYNSLHQDINYTKQYMRDPDFYSQYKDIKMVDEKVVDLILDDEPHVQQPPVDFRDMKLFEIYKQEYILWWCYDRYKMTMGFIRDVCFPHLEDKDERLKDWGYEMSMVIKNLQKKDRYFIRNSELERKMLENWYFNIQMNEPIPPWV